MKKGLFITLEGPEGAGKTSQREALGAYLEAMLETQVVMTREPGGCDIANKIRAILLDSENKALTPKAELLLYAAARAQHVTEVIVPALAEGNIVLCDRFSDSTVAYQGFGRGLDKNLIRNLNNVASNVVPDLTILLDVPAEVGLARSLKRHNGSTVEARFEQEELAFHQRVRSGYLAMAKVERDRFVVVDATMPESEVLAEVCRIAGGFVREGLDFIRDERITLQEAICR